MMRALTCPKCGAPLQVGMQACPYCGVGLVPDDPKPSPSSRREGPPAQVPAGWLPYRDPWHGFTLAHPPGWQVVTHRGQISIREDPVGVTAAMIWPFSLPAPSPACQVARQFVSLARSTDPSFQAWQQGNAAADSTRLTLRTRQAKYGSQLEGYFNILVDGTDAVISGYECPVEAVSKRSPVMAAILSTFRTSELMPRQVVQEPSEGAYSISLPTGWLFQGSVNRNNIGGSALPQYVVSRDPQSRVCVAMPWYHWTFMDGMAGLFGGFSAYPSGRFLPAGRFCAQNLASWMGGIQSGFRVEAVVDRPDLAGLFIQELASSGYPPGMFELTAAVIETSYDENGIRMRQKSRVNTQRQRSGMGAIFGSSPLWTASLDVYYRAPEEEFSVWEPVLCGIMDSSRPNPAWQMGERRLAENFIANSQQDIQRRTHQLSQTLSETSDIINNSYWNRQAVHDRLSEMRSNATLGLQNMASPSGEVYKVPTGYDQYWKDGLGNLYGGSWLSQPDVNWTPLEPTGI